MTQKQNGVLEWLQSCETPAPSEPKIKAVIVAGKSYMNSSEFNKNSMRDIILNQLQYLKATSMVCGKLNSLVEQRW